MSGISVRHECRASVVANNNNITESEHKNASKIRYPRFAWGMKIIHEHYELWSINGFKKSQEQHFVPDLVRIIGIEYLTLSMCLIIICILPVWH